MKRYLHAKHALPNCFYTVAQAFTIDASAKNNDIEQGYVLMQKAGKAAFELLLKRFASIKSIAVLCGYGNNGGDGLVLASLAQQCGWHVDVYMLGDIPRFTHEAKLAYDAFGGKVKVWSNSVCFEHYDVIVDGLLGIGFKGDLSENLVAIIEAVNRASAPVLSLDVPTGVYADSGNIATVAIQATATISFIALKQGLVTGRAVDYVGELYFDDLAVSASLSPSATAITPQQIAQLIPRYQPSVHKGSRGHAFCLGGMQGMIGALILSAQASFAVGAGKVSVVNDGEPLSALFARMPEVMHKTQHDISQATAIAIGMGLGKTTIAQALLQWVLDDHYKVPMVLDADALNMIGSCQVHLDKYGNRNNMIFTPHPLEAARLLGVSVEVVERNRFEAVRQLHQRYGAVIVLKGAGTLIYDGHEMVICPYGNPYMGVAGMGDVLSGVIAGLLAQGIKPMQAATLGVFLHAYSADQIVLEQGGFGLSASRLSTEIAHQMNHLLGLVE